MEKGKEKVSFNPTNITTAGFIDDVTVKFVNCRAENTDYEGRGSMIIPAFVADLQDPDDENNVQTQYWKAGDPEHWEADENGFAAIGTKTKLNGKSKFVQFVLSCVNSGFDAEKIENDVTVFEGMVAHVISIEETYKGLKNDDGTDRTGNNLIVDRIEVLPYEKSKGKTSKKSGGGKKETAVESDGGVGGGDANADAAIAFVMGKLAEAGEDGVAKKDLFKQAFADPDLKKAKINQDVSKLVYMDEFLSSGPWTYEDGIVKA